MHCIPALGDRLIPAFESPFECHLSFARRKRVDSDVKAENQSLKTLE